MPAIRKDGTTNYTLGAGGAASTLRLGATGTTTYTLGGSGLVNGHYVLAGGMTSYTLGPGDTATQSYTLVNGLSSYNLNPSGTGSTSYSLNPSGTSTGSNLAMGPSSGTTTYTLGAGSSTTSTATLGSGSTHSINLDGAGATATITTTISGVTTTVTLGPGDSASTTIVSDALAELAESLDKDLFPSAEETTTYNLGDGGQSTSTYGSNTWGVFLVRNINGFPSTAPFLAILAKDGDGYAKSAPNFGIGGDIQVGWDLAYKQDLTIETPDGPQSVTVANPPFDSAWSALKCQRVLIADIVWNDTKQGWDVIQRTYGTLTLPEYWYLAGVLYGTPGAATQPWDGWPLLTTQNNEWNGEWNGSQKVLTFDNTDPFPPY